MYMYKLNLQLFSDDLEDEFIEDEFIDEGEQLEDAPVEEPEIIEEEETDDLDSKTRAIIKHKKEAKELRRQNEELQKKLEEIELEKQKSQRVVELTRQGKNPEEATKQATEEMEKQALRTQLTRLELQMLEQKHPGITNYAQELMSDKSKLPDFTLEQIYLAKYASKSKFDEKTRTEQQLAYAMKEANDKALEPSNAKATKQVSLTREQEKAFLYLKKYSPHMTRKQFLELENQEILE